MPETTPKIPQRIQVPARTVDGTHTPSTGVAATICRTAISRNTIEWASATMALAVRQNGESAHAEHNCSEQVGFML